MNCCRFAWLLALGLEGAALLPAQGQIHVLTYHNDNARTGQNLKERLLTPANVNASTFGKLVTHALDGYVFAQPLYVSGLNLPTGRRNVVFVATEHNSVYAFDADRTDGSALLWQSSLGPSAATPTADFGSRYGQFTDIVPEIGITGTPVIDLGAGALYVDTFTHEGSAYYHWLHALSLTNGAERANSPVLVSASIAGTGAGSVNGVVSFDPQQQLQRSALTLAGGRLYVAYAGYNDTDPYHGWVLGFDPANLDLLPGYVFNTTPNSSVAGFGPNAGEGGIWMAGCGPSADAAGSLFFAVGNGSFNALNNAGGTEYGDSVLRLSTSQGLAVADYFTPYNQEYLGGNDLDLGSGGMMLLPDQPGPYPHLMVGGGKEGTVYLLNRDQMTLGNNHYNNGGGSDAVLQTFRLGGRIVDTPAYFNSSIYFAAAGDVLAQFPLVDGAVDVGNYTASARTFPYPGATPSISANGNNQGIVWVLSMGSPGLLVAYDANDLGTELYNSSQAANGRDQLPNGVKFTVPTIANGKVYVGGQYGLSVFGLLESPYAAWKAAHFGANANNPAIAGDQADPDGDHVPNILEYAFAMDPNSPDAYLCPSGTVVSDHFQMAFRRNLSATDLTYSIQRATALNGTWTTLFTLSAASCWVPQTPGAALSELATTGTAPDQSVSVALREQASPTGSAFFRIAVQQP